ncbi:hypothetical protein CEXT_424711 [Caerostris extrusa]|uniref:Uncharacterized protein n=1 Tax=Caerostris extrusa TaxID=172846 RepID=A0AAV4V479_CAEEX|nr:hypothetical protein CEXT_424711 [Caerostris extrusa]
MHKILNGTHASHPRPNYPLLKPFRIAVNELLQSSQMIPARTYSNNSASFRYLEFPEEPFSKDSEPLMSIYMASAAYRLWESVKPDLRPSYSVSYPPKTPLRGISHLSKRISSNFSAHPVSYGSEVEN